MHWRADAHAGLGPETAGQTQHLGPVGLQREVSYAPRVGILAYVAGPAEGGLKPTVCPRRPLDLVGPAPVPRIRLPVQLEKCLRLLHRAPEPDGQTFWPHAVLNAEGTLLELLPLVGVRLLGSTAGDSTGLPGKSQIRVLRA